MQPLMILLSVALTLLLVKSGASMGIPMMRQMRYMRYPPLDMMPFGMLDPRPMEIVEQSALESPEFKDIKELCEKYDKGPKVPDLGDATLEAILVEECEAWLQGRGGNHLRLIYLQKKVTVKPKADDTSDKQQKSGGWWFGQSWF